MELITLILLLAAAFVAGIVDSIAGGGGLITVPSLLLAGLQPQSALGTNKFMSSSGTGIAVFNFQRKKIINWKLIISGILFALIGSFIGAKAATPPINVSAEPSKVRSEYRCGAAFPSTESGYVVMAA